MLAKQETRRYAAAERVWIGKYKNSHNVLHWHYACELLYVESGTIEVFCGEKTYLLTKSDAFFIDSGEVHYMHAQEGTVLIVMMFENDVIKKLTENKKPASPRLSRGYDIPVIYERLAEELTEKKPFYNAAAENEIFSLFLKIFREEILETRKTYSDTAQAFKDLLSDINENYADYTFSDAARFMGFSEAYFSKYFKKIAGMTFSQYLNRVKTEKAIALLQQKNAFSITQIAIQCGFNTIRNFNRIFKDVTGYTPKSLPHNYSLEENFIYAVNREFNPTSNETTLLTEL